MGIARGEAYTFIDSGYGIERYAGEGSSYDGAGHGRVPRAGACSTPSSGAGVVAGLTMGDPCTTSMRTQIRT